MKPATRTGHRVSG